MNINIYIYILIIYKLVNYKYICILLDHLNGVIVYSVIEKSLVSSLIWDNLGQANLFSIRCNLPAWILFAIIDSGIVLGSKFSGTVA